MGEMMWDVTEAQAATMMRRFVCESPESPEGIELFDWLWYHEATEGVRLPKPFWYDINAPLSPSVPWEEWCVFPFVQLRCGRHYGRAGWEREARTAVLFFAKGGVLPDMPRPPSRIDALAEEGDAEREREALARFCDKLRELADESGVSDGEDWKRADL